MSEVKPHTITPEIQIGAQRVAAIFQSMHQFLDSLKHKGENDMLLMSEQLRNAHARIEEAAQWAVKHVLTFGIPAQPEAPNVAAPDPTDNAKDVAAAKDEPAANA